MTIDAPGPVMLPASSGLGTNFLPGGQPMGIDRRCRGCLEWVPADKVCPRCGRCPRCHDCPGPPTDAA